MSENTQNNSQNGDFFNNTVSGVDAAPKKGKGKKIAIISGISLAVIAGGGIAAYNFSDLIKNQVNLRVMKPEKYYAWVNEENARTLAKEISDDYKLSLDNYAKGQTGNLSLSFEATDAAKSYFKDNFLSEDMDDEEREVMNALIDKFNSVKVGSDYAAKDGLFSGNVYADYNGERLATFECAFDEPSMDFFMRVPELAEQWLGVSMGDMLDEVTYDDEETERIMELYKDVMKDPSKYLTPEQLEDMIVRYANIWSESVKDIEIEKKEEIDICDISVNYTVMSVELTPNDLIKIGKNYIKEMKNDKVIKGILIDKAGVCSADEYESVFDELLGELDESRDYGGNAVFVIDEYVDAKGVVRGFGASVPGAGEARIVMGKDGDNVRGEGIVEVMGEELLNAQLVADEKNDAYTGDLTVTVNDNDETYTGTLEFTDFKVVNEERGYVSGDITIKIPEIDPISFELSSNGKSQSIAYEVVIDGTDFGKATLTMGAEYGATITVPSKGDAKMIDVEGDETQLEEYVAPDKLRDFIYNILKKIGVSDEFAAEIADEAKSEAFDEYDDFDEDFDIEDEEDEDEDEPEFDEDYFKIEEEEETSEPAEEAPTEAVSAEAVTAEAVSEAATEASTENKAA